MCTECDIALNEHDIRMMFGKERELDLMFYALGKRIADIAKRMAHDRRKAASMVEQVLDVKVAA